MRNLLLLLFFGCLLLSCNQQDQSMEEEVYTPPIPSKLLLADSLIQAEQLEEGIQIYDEVLAKLLIQKSYAEYVHFQTRLANALRKEDQQEKAIERLGEAIHIGEQHLDNQIDTFLANAYHKKGVNHLDIYQYEASMKNFNLALEIRTRSLPKDHPHLANGFYAIGNSCVMGGEYHKAVEAYKKALDMPGGLPESTENVILDLLGFSYGQIGEMDLAEKYLNILLNRLNVNNQSSTREIAEVYKSLAGIASDRKNYDTALKHIQKAILILQSHQSLDFRDSLRLLNVLNDAGLIYLEMDSNRIAISFFLECLSIIKKYNEAGDLEIDLADVMNNISLAYSGIGAYPLAFNYQFSALKIYQRKNLINDIARSQHNIGCYYDYTNQLSLALKYHQQTIQNQVSGFSSETLYDLPNLNEINPRLIEVPKYLAFKGRVLWKMYLTSKKTKDLIAAFETYSLSIDLCLKNQKLLRFDGSKVNLIVKNFEYFQDAVEVCFELARVKQSNRYEKLAFQVAELSKSTSLAQSISENENYRKNPTESKEQILDLQSSISKIETSIYNEQQLEKPSKSLIQNNQEQLIKLYNKYDQITIREINTGTTDKLHHNKINIESIQEHIGADQTAISYFNGKEMIYAFLIQKDTFLSKKIVLSPKLKDDLNAFRTSIEELSEEKVSIIPFQKLGFNLYQKLLTSFEPYLTRRLIIIPDGSLRSIPFDALVDNALAEEDELKYKDLFFLVKKHAISYHYSASLLLKALTNKPNTQFKSSKKIVAFSPDFSPLKNKIDHVKGNNRIALGPLFYNKFEVKSIGKIYPTKVFDGRLANKQNFQREAPNYEVIHLATHAVINDQNPERSFIAFSQAFDTLDLTNIIYVDEIYHLPIQAKLIVLSACQTGVGKLYDGEGMMSLARAFMYAGAQSLLTTLWEINDEQSAYLIRSYYANLKKGEPNDVALQKAKLNQINTYSSNPSNWAPFIQIGNAQKF